MNNLVDTTRPKTLDEIVGMEYNKKILHYDIHGCLKLNQPLPHYLISGAAGTGKSTIANVISILSGGQIHKYIGPEIKKPANVYDIALNAKDKDVVYIEEAHGIGKEAQIVLLEWMENYQLLGSGGLGTAPKVSFVLPTTNPGKLTKPLRERCKILHTGYYSIDNLKEILVRAAKHFNLDLTQDDAALELLAQSSRGTPRTAIMQRLDMIRKIMAVDNLPFNYESVERMLKTSDINPWGLEPLDIKYCETLYHKIEDNGNKPVGKKVICQTLGLDDDAIDVIEGYLQQISAISIVTGGRILTKFGCELIDKEPISNNIITKLNRKADNKIDLERLREMVQDPEICRIGMRKIAEEFNLKYGSDNALIKEALSQIGYTSVRRAGIVPM